MQTYFGATIAMLTSALREPTVQGLTSDGAEHASRMGLGRVDTSTPDGEAVALAALQYGEDQVRSLVLQDGMEEDTTNDANLAHAVIDYAIYFLYRRESGQTGDKNPGYAGMKMAEKRLIQRQTFRLERASGVANAPFTVGTIHDDDDPEYGTARRRRMGMG